MQVFRRPYLHEWRSPPIRQPKRSTGLALSRPGCSATKPGNKTSSRALREPSCSYSCCSHVLSIRRQPTTNPMTSRRYRRTPAQHRHYQKSPTPVKVRNVAGLSYTTSSALIFSSRRCFWASNSAIAALVDTGSLVYLIASLWCRSKDAAGEPQEGRVGKLAARVTTCRLTRPKLVVKGSQQHHQNWRLHLCHAA